MEAIFIKNTYEIIDDYVIINIKRVNGDIFKTLVSLSDLEKMKNFNYSWYVHYCKNSSSYYVLSTVYLGTFNGKPKYKSMPLHKFIMDAEDNTYVDHINHDSLDNRRENLRVVTNNENTKNRKSKNSNNKSGYRNVSKQGKFWVVQMQIDGQNIILNRFPLDKLEEAGFYAKEMRRILYGEFAGES